LAALAVLNADRLTGGAGMTERMRMRRILAIAAVAASAAAGLFAFAPTANAAGQACVNAHVVVNGQDVVNQASCVPLDTP
jgi:hypothetical protein